MKYTFEEFMENEESGFFESKKKKVGEEIHFCHPENFIHVYQDITSWFSSLIDRFPSIQFVYRHTFFLEVERVSEEVSLVIKEEGAPVRMLVADVWKGDEFISPRLHAAEMGESAQHIKFELSTFQEWIPFFLAAIQETDRYRLCNKEYTADKNQVATFTKWKETIKSYAAETCKIEQEDDGQLCVIPKQATTTCFRFFYEEKLTKKLQENKIHHMFLGRTQVIDNGILANDEYRCYFYHENQLMIMSLKIMEEGVWQGLKTEICYTNKSWDPSNWYELHDLDELKKQVLDLVKEEPNVRLYVVTSGVNQD